MVNKNLILITYNTREIAQLRIVLYVGLSIFMQLLLLSPGQNILPLSSRDSDPETHPGLK